MRRSAVVGSSDRIIVALDTPVVEEAAGLVRQLQGSVGAFKVGLEFLHAAGPAGVRAVQSAGARRLFIDGKFSDIPNTVAGAVRSACLLDPWLLNVHAMAGPSAMRAAMGAVVQRADTTGRRPLLIAVTVLTSLDQEQLRAVGIHGRVDEAVLRLSKLAQDCGLDGVVASPLEIGLVRRSCGPDFLIVTPGIRPAGSSAHDQSRVSTPGAAFTSGADYVVVGRTITAAADPKRAAELVEREIDAAAAAAARTGLGTAHAHA